MVFETINGHSLWLKMKTRETIALLREYESRNVMFFEPDGSWPIIWERAKGVHVWI